MPMDRFLIAPFKTGLQTNVRPFLIMDDAFVRLNNAYVFRGRVTKRFGSTYSGSGADAGYEQLRSRAAIQVGTVGAPTSPVPGAIFKIGQSFSVGDIIFTVVTTGVAQSMLVAPVFLGNTDSSGNASGTTPTGQGSIGQTFVIGSVTFTVAVANGALTPSSGTGTGTFNTVTGVFTFTGCATNTSILWNTNATGTFSTTNGAFVISGTGYSNPTPIFFYPSESIMGITTFTQSTAALSDQPVIVFDTQFSYTFNGASWARSGTVMWHGNNNNFFWGANWQSTDSTVCAFFASNFQVLNLNGAINANDDPIYYTTDAVTWNSFQPFTVVTNTGGMGPVITTIKTARIILPFKNRLILLNTVETDGTNNKNFINRCRFSINGSPFAGTAGNYFGWLEPNQMNGTGVGSGAGFIDAPIEEEIVSAQFIKDRLIVYFERSTYELAYTGNEILPFVWQKLNDELGAVSTFSPIAFDQSILVMADVGIHACNGANVERIDVTIPDQILNDLDRSEALTRVAGIRDYFNEMVYWSFPSQFNGSGVFPDRVMVYNYRNNTWAFNDDCITAFGYFEQQAGKIWSDATFTWQSSDDTWDSFIEEPQARQILMGNPQGFLTLLNENENQNASNMPITNIQAVSQVLAQVTIIDNNLKESDFILITGAIVLPDAIYQVASAPTTTTFNIITTQAVSGTYKGGATAARVSRIDILTKPWNPYLDKGRNVFISKIDFSVLKTALGAITVDYFPSYTNYSTLQNASVGVLLGTGVLETSPYDQSLYPLEQLQDQLWHPIYLQTDGEAVQLRIYFSDGQMANTNIVASDFELEAMILNTSPTTARLQ